MASGLLGVGLSGLLAAHRSLTVTGNNIINANTDGNSRQRVDLSTRPPQLYGSSYVGNGVDVSSVSRVYDNFLVDGVRTGTSSYESLNTFANYAARIDNLLANPDAGVGTAIQSFFTAANQVSSAPSSQPARQVLLSQANNLADTFKYVGDRFAELGQQSNTSLKDSVGQINALASGIAELNQNIITAIGAASGGLPNDLLDKRDAALTQLFKLVSMTVFIGSGQALVVGTKTQQLSVIRNNYDPSRSEIGYTVGSTTVEITNQLSGGTIGGLINFRSQIFDFAQNALGRVVTGLADAVNTQHQLGVDLSGALGGKLFTTGAMAVAQSASNTGSGSVSAALVSADALTTSDYQLQYNGANSYTLTRANDGKAFAINTGGSSPYTSTTIDGIALTISSGAAVGGSFLVRPTYAAAGSLQVAISDPAKIAAAAPIRASTALSNVGGAKISAGAVNSPDDRLMVQFTAPGVYNVVDQPTGATLGQGLSYSSGGNIAFNGLTFKITNGAGTPASGDKFYIDKKVTSADSANTGAAAIGQVTASPPAPHLRDAVSIVFTSPTTYNVVGATTGSPLTNVPYTSGSTISYNGWNVAISGTPVTGDTFTVGNNANGVGDNRNALQLSGLQQKLTLAGGTATFQDAYGQIVADVGSKTQQSNIARDARNALLKQSVEARDSVSGVNLDEEAANLIKMQQAYQAAAHVITMANTLFLSILDAVQ